MLGQSTDLTLLKAATSSKVYQKDEEGERREEGRFSEALRHTFTDLLNPGELNGKGDSQRELPCNTQLRTELSYHQEI